MPLNTDNIIQNESGSFNGTSGTVSLPVATTADSHVLIFAMSGGDGTTSISALDPPTGFEWASDSMVNTLDETTPYCFWKKTSGGETSWTLGFGAAPGGQVLWRAVEVTGLDLLAPVHVASGITPFDGGTQVTTRSTGSTAATSSYDVLAFAILPGKRFDGDAPGWSGYTNGFAELGQHNRIDGSDAVSLAVAVKPSATLGQHECTASLDVAANSRATMVVFTAEGAKWAATVDAMCGFEVGTATGIAARAISTGAEGAAYFDEVGGSPTVTTSTPRSGSYCLELSSSAAAEFVAWHNDVVSIPNLGVLAEFEPSSAWQGPLVTRFNVRFPTSLPGADVELASVDAGAAATLTIWFRAASSKIGVKIGTGTEVLSDATVSADTWVGIDYRYDASVANHLCDWAVTYDSSGAQQPTEQTQAVGSGEGANVISKVRFGWHTARTATVRYDDIIVSKVRNNYPIGGYKIVGVGPEGTATVISGASTDFRNMTANGTLATFDGAAVTALLAEVPPGVGASSNGLVMVNVASSKVEVPMGTFQAAPDNVLRAVRAYFVGWAASGNPAAIEFSLWDGVSTVVVVLATGADQGFDDTNMIWACRMFRPGSSYYLVTQAKLDAMTARIGNASDANPDVGCLFARFEVAYEPALVYEGSNIEDAFFVHIKQDALSQGVASHLVTVPAGDRGATYTLSLGGVDQTPHYVEPNATQVVTWEQVIGATEIGTVTGYSFSADPA